MAQRSFLLSCVYCFFALVCAAQDTSLHIVPGRSNSAVQQQKPYLILISIDGFRYDYAKKYHAKNLLALSGNGVRAKAMQPGFPSLTFPNHYTLVTGLYPAHHGLVDNTFYDRGRQQAYDTHNRQAVEDGTWYGGTPLWVLAEKQQMVSASYFWVGSEAAIQDTRPTYYFKYNELQSIDSRIQQVVSWLSLPADKRPHLITFYFPEVDHAGHTYGPESAATRQAVQMVDAAIGKMAAAVARLQLPVNYIVVSDHGMMEADTAHPIMLDNVVSLDDCTVAAGNEKFMIYNNDSARIRQLYDTLKAKAQHYRVFLKKETPARWHYGQDDRYNRIGDLIVLADAGYAFSRKTRILPGHHGYDNNETRMNAVFMAWGPAFKKHAVIPAFANVHVYPLVTSILGLQVTAPIDGRPEVLKNILQK
jgi:predicted AlkP superfamily pyrophosphatase or phosphodiesterase